MPARTRFVRTHYDDMRIDAAERSASEIVIDYGLLGWGASRLGITGLRLNFVWRACGVPEDGCSTVSGGRGPPRVGNGGERKLDAASE